MMSMKSVKSLSRGMRWVGNLIETLTNLASLESSSSKVTVITHQSGMLELSKPQGHLGHYFLKMLTAIVHLTSTSLFHSILYGF